MNFVFDLLSLINHTKGILNYMIQLNLIIFGSINISK